MKRLALPALLATLALSACAHGPQRLDYVTLDSPSMRRPMQYAAYLPPGFGPDERLPLLIFLHGAGDSPRSFESRGAAALLDQALQDGRVPRAVIVVPQGDMGMWTNWHDGTRHYEDWVVQEVMRDAIRRFHTLPCPEGCHLAGASMGGAGALRIALHHPGQFASVSSLSGPVFDSASVVRFANSRRIRSMIPVDRIFGPVKAGDDLSQEDLYARWRTPEDLKGLRLFLAWGDRDRREIVETNRRFARHLARRGIPFREQEYAGGHDWEHWNQLLVPLMQAQLGAAN